jgi:hypothetical protein
MVRGSNALETNVVLFLSLAIVLSISMCGKSSDDTEKRILDWPIPDSLSEKAWRATVLVIARNEYSTGRKPLRSDLSYPRRIDWFKTLGNRFAAVYSLRDTLSLSYFLWFGVQDGGDISLTFLAENGKSLTEVKKNLKWYLRALDHDSLWLLFSDKPFWSSANSWDSYSTSHRFTKLENLNYEYGMYFTPYYLVPPPFRDPKLASRKIWPSIIGMPFAFAYDEPFEQYVNDQNTLTMLDYATLVGDKFALIACRRDEERGAYAIAIGRLDGHLMTYRLVGNGIHTLEGMGLLDYIDLLVNDRVSSLIGHEGFGETEESMNLLYDSYFNDSLTTEYQTRTLHLDSLFEPGYLNRVVQ